MKHKCICDIKGDKSKISAQNQTYVLVHGMISKPADFLHFSQKAVQISDLFFSAHKDCYSTFAS